MDKATNELLERIRSRLQEDALEEADEMHMMRRNANVVASYMKKLDSPKAESIIDKNLKALNKRWEAYKSKSK